MGKREFDRSRGNQARNLAGGALIGLNIGRDLVENVLTGVGTPMRPAEIQTDDIIDAGQQLESQGRLVNGWNLRRALGDKGRPDHLIEVWQSHRGVVPAASADAGPVVLPPELAEQANRGCSELAALYDGLVLKAFEQADALLKEHYQVDFERFVAERGELQEQLASASASISATETALTKALLGVERMREALVNAQTEIVRAEKQIRAVEEQRERDAQAAGQQVADLQAQVAALSSAAHQARKTIVAAESEARHLREQVTRLASSAEAARSESAAMSAEAAAGKAEKAAEQRRADRAEQACAAAAAAAHAAAATLRRESQQLHEKLAQLTSALDEAKSSAASQRHRAEKAEQALAYALEVNKKAEDKTGIIYIE